jgi:hypothetical protein
MPVLEALGAREVLVAFDADWREKLEVARALTNCARHLLKSGYTAWFENWTPDQGKGIDDYLLRHGHGPTRYIGLAALRCARSAAARKVG